VLSVLKNWTVETSKKYKTIVERFRKLDCRNLKKVHRSLLSVLEENYGL
jgi:hypothetical protein